MLPCPHIIRTVFVALLDSPGSIPSVVKNPKEATEVGDKNHIEGRGVGVLRALLFTSVIVDVSWCLFGAGKRAVERAG